MEKILSQKKFNEYCFYGSVQGFWGCVPQDLFDPKLQAYGLSEDAVTLMHSYLKRRKQSVKIKDTEY